MSGWEHAALFALFVGCLWGISYTATALALEGRWFGFWFVTVAGSVAAFSALVVLLAGGA